MGHYNIKYCKYSDFRLKIISNNTLHVRIVGGALMYSTPSRKNISSGHNLTPAKPSLHTWYLKKVMFNLENFINMCTLLAADSQAVLRPCRFPPLHPSTSRIWNPLDPIGSCTMKPSSCINGLLEFRQDQEFGWILVSQLDFRWSAWEKIPFLKIIQHRSGEKKCASEDKWSDHIILRNYSS